MKSTLFLKRAANTPTECSLKAPPQRAQRSRRSNSLRWLLLAVVCAGIWTVAGCSTSDPENVSSRPWNAPKDWETGLPSSMFEGR